MRNIHFYTFIYSLLLSCPLFGQYYSETGSSDTDTDNTEIESGSNYMLFLDDASLEIGINAIGVFALDDKAPLSANPHFQAMWNLIKLGASIESLLQGTEEPINDIDLSRNFGHNGYNKTTFMLFVRYGFGESSDVALQRHYFELVYSPGYFREGKKGSHLHLDYQLNFLKTPYGAGGNSMDRFIDYEIFTGLRIGKDGSFGRSESEAGFFSHLNEELERIAQENELTASQLIMLQDLAETSKVLLPEDVGGRSFHVGPILGARVTKRIFGNTRLFATASGFYDLMDLDPQNRDVENRRSQHHFSLLFGINTVLGANGVINDTFPFME